jgi:hypothetical protein
MKVPGRKKLSVNETYDVPLYRDFTRLMGARRKKAGRSTPEHILNANVVQH